MSKLFTIMKKIIFVIIFVVIIFSRCPRQLIKADSSSEWYDSGEFRETTYYRTYHRWINQYQEVGNVNLSVLPIDVATYNPQINLIDDDLYDSKIFAPDKGDEITFMMDVSQTGLYYLTLDYRYNTTFTNNPTVDIVINNEIQYNEMSQIRLPISYVSTVREEENRYNRYGDELIPYAIALNRWYHEFLSDAFNESTKPNCVLLTKGQNEIRILINDENLLIGAIGLGNLKTVKGYDEYLSAYQNANKPKQVVTIQGQDICFKNDIEIKPSYYKSYTMTPANYKKQVLNMLDGNSMSLSGRQVTYQFDVEEDGLYQLSFKYKQNSIAGVAVGRNIYLDGEIPFAQMQDYLFPYTKSWTNHTLNDGSNNYWFYLTKGLHTITFEATSVHNVDVIDQLYQVMDQLNSMGITINTITGSSSNTQITWKITNYLPNIATDLQNCAAVLENAYQYINGLNSSTKEASEVSTLVMAAKALRRLAKSPNKIQNRLGELSEGSGSAYQLVGSAIGYLMNQSFDIDYFCFNYDGYKMAKPNGNIFGRIWFSIKSFFYSFFDERYNTKISNDKNTIDVLVASSSLYTNIMQEMIDDEFTKETGIKVRLNILSNTQSIVLNNATGTNPDVILDLDSWVPYTYALRGMLADLSQFEGFDDVTKEIYSSNFTPLIFEKGVYGIPATQGMQLLFFRTDILQALDLEAPNTWEEVLKMLPTLQSYQMNFYHPLGSDSAYKGFGLTSQFFYLYDSEMYTANGFTSNLVDEASVEAIQYMTDLFNIYNLPQQVSSFFEHFRSGTLPIGIAGIDMYLQLKYACPELAGQWDILPIPGMYNEEKDVVERWTSTYGKCSIMFKASKKQNVAWEFLKWWHQSKIQTAYVQKIKSYLGEKYLIVPANMQALSDSPWDYQIKSEIMAAAKWSRIPAITPGSYIVEREISNIWNKVVINKVNVRVAINQSIPKINRELKRKFEEFKYLENGKIVKDY